MKKTLLLFSTLFIIACSENTSSEKIVTEKISTDTIEVSKNFIKSLMIMDEKIIEEIKHPYAGSDLSIKYFLASEHKALKASNISIEELKYTVELGRDEHICVVVESIGTRKTSYGLLPIHWRLGFEKAPNKENFLLLYLDSINEGNGYNDNGCR